MLYASGKGPAEARIPLEPDLNRTGDVWHVTISGFSEPVWAMLRYGFRVRGPDDPAMDRVLIDPYAKGLSGGAVWGSPLERPGYVPDAGYVRRCFIPRDTFGGGFDWHGDRPINRPLKDTVIYEMHVRGFTRHGSSGVKAPGTFAGIIEKIPYLKSLGVTAVELMPINEFDELENDRRDPMTGATLKNYWGYSTINFFSPKASYASAGIEGGQVTEFKTMVRELHRSGIEVILDVVFNHTAEGNEKGPTFSFKGFDKGVYYMLNPDGTYKNYSGCGNTMNCNHPLVHDMIIDCLRYWVIEMHVDGFRFDLASILGRDENGGVLSNPPVVDAIDEDPVLSRTKIIAEAWDAAGLYQVGKFHSWSRWAEWNGKYRDDTRKFLKGDPGAAGVLATRLAGSSDLYHTSGRKPYHSINFITSHDGFTLMDLFSYNGKHNWRNGEDNRDGTNDNLSWNCGIEGSVKKPQILAERFRKIKNAWTFLMLSQGTPMVLAGDEFGHTQGGNNNAYCQDNPVSWIDWSLAEINLEILEFVKKAIGFRLSHPALRREYFFSGGGAGDSLPDVSWHGVKPWQPDFTGTSRTLAMLINGSMSDPVDCDIYAAFNGWNESLAFEIPGPGRKWRRWLKKIDTAAERPDDFHADGVEPPLIGKKLTLTPMSVVVLVSGS